MEEAEAFLLPSQKKQKKKTEKKNYQRFLSPTQDTHEDELLDFNNWGDDNNNDNYFDPNSLQHVNNQEGVLTPPPKRHSTKSKKKSGGSKKTLAQVLISSPASEAIQKNQRKVMKQSNSNLRLRKYSPHFEQAKIAL